MANYKLIKNIQIGDEVVCFNPNTYRKQLFQKLFIIIIELLIKLVYNIKLISGRTITATYDHKFMTNQGWVKV